MIAALRAMALATLMFAGACAHVSVRRAALEELAATVAAGIAAGSGHGTAHACPAQSSSPH
jgi:hypothetical protein